MRHFFILIQILFLTACVGTAQHNVKVHDAQAFSTDTKVILGTVANKTGENFDVDIEAMLEAAMEKKLSGDNLLGQKGDSDLVSMDVSIIEYRKGDAFKRWLWPGYGSTVLVIEATLLDSEGNVDATAQANRSVDAGGGYTIGAWKKIFEDVANDLVEDLRSNIDKAQANSP
jgi:hypothetical protein